MSQYICCGTHTTWEGKPWITIDMKRWDDIPGPIVFSSYLEYKLNLMKLPKQHFHLVVNKEDFQHIRPILHTRDKDDFPYLTETEINRLSDEQYRQYKEDLSETYLLNPERASVYENGIQDVFVSDESSDSDELLNDDY